MTNHGQTIVDGPWPARDHTRVKVAGAALVGYVLGRRHSHPVATAVLALVALAGLVVLVAAFWPFVVAGVLLVAIVRWRSQGRPWSRIGATVGYLALSILAIVLAGTFGIGWAGLTAVGCWAAWHGWARHEVARLGTPFRLGAQARS